MTMTYVALFRGINVGGKNIVKMAELRQLLSGLGFKNIKTYIQSGNAIFDSSDAPESIKENLQSSFQSAFKFESSIILRTKNELIKNIASLPFSEPEIEAATSANPNVEHLYFYFTDNMLSGDTINTLNTEHGKPDRLSAGQGGVYLLCYESVRDSRLAAALVKQNAAMTARNWKTLNKLFDMMQ